MRNDSDAPARFAMPSSWAGDGYVAIRPDSNTALIVGPGFRRIVPLDEDLGYWDGSEGAVSEVNLFAVEVTQDDDDPDGYHTSYARVGPLVGGSALGLSVYELPPGQSICPYHYETGEEEWLFVLVGAPTLRTPEGEQQLRPWDMRVLPATARRARTR